MCRLYSFISQSTQVSRPAHNTLVAKSLGSFITIKSSSPPHSLSPLQNLTIHKSIILPLQTSLSQLFYIPSHQQNTFLSGLHPYVCILLSIWNFFPSCTHPSPTESQMLKSNVTSSSKFSLHSSASHNLSTAEFPQVLPCLIQVSDEIHFK